MLNSLKFWNENCMYLVKVKAWGLRRFEGACESHPWPAPQQDRRLRGGGFEISLLPTVSNETTAGIFLTPFYHCFLVDVLPSFWVCLEWQLNLIVFIIRLPFFAWDSRNCTHSLTNHKFSNEMQNIEAYRQLPIDGSKNHAHCMCKKKHTN